MVTHSRANRGQVLIVAALVLVMMLLSTALYIADTQKNQLKAQSENSPNLPFYKQGVRHTMISALANISNGGNVSTLQIDLNTFNLFVSEHSFGAFFQSAFTLSNIASYQNGVWLSQNVSGKAIISAYVTFNVSSSGAQEETQSSFTMNITSMIQTQGYYTQQNGSKQAQLTCKVFNEGQPALARNFSVSYVQDGSLDSENWTTIEAPNVTDSGDGTYTITFNATIDQPENPLLIWFSCQDQRGITLQTLLQPVLQ